MDFDFPTLLNEEPSEEARQQALIAALRRQEERQDAARGDLRDFRAG